MLESEYEYLNDGKYKIAWADAIGNGTFGMVCKGRARKV
jgi:hypothetical protein